MTADVSSPTFKAIARMANDSEVVPITEGGPVKLLELYEQSTRRSPHSSLTPPEISTSGRH
jgi:hypothetical protein